MTQHAQGEVGKPEPGRDGGQAAHDAPGDPTGVAGASIGLVGVCEELEWTAPNGFVFRGTQRELDAYRRFLGWTTVELQG